MTAIVQSLLFPNCRVLPICDSRFLLRVLCVSVVNLTISQTPAPPVPAARPPRDLARETRATACRPRGPKSSVQSFTYMPTKLVGLLVVQVAAVAQRVSQRILAMRQPVFDALLQQPLRLRGSFPCPDSCARRSPPAAAAGRCCSFHQRPRSTTSCRLLIAVRQLAFVNDQPGIDRLAVDIRRPQRPE